MRIGDRHCPAGSGSNLSEFRSLQAPDRERSLGVSKLRSMCHRTLNEFIQETAARTVASVSALSVFGQLQIRVHVQRHRCGARRFALIHLTKSKKNCRAQRIRFANNLTGDLTSSTVVRPTLHAAVQAHLAQRTLRSPNPLGQINSVLCLNVNKILHQKSIRGASG